MKLEEKVGELLKAKKLSLSTAESCTGGGIAALITSVPGSSEYFNGSIVAYSNEIKMSLLHVSAETLEKHGAVSRETVTEMVKGAMKTLKTDCAVATSGIAGPGGGTPEKPVGLVKEEGPSGITVNCVAPGVIDTDMMAAFTAEDKAALAEETPVGRLGSADEVAQLLVFLAGESAGYITGQVFGVNGGLVI